MYFSKQYKTIAVVLFYFVMFAIFVWALKKDFVYLHVVKPSHFTLFIIYMYFLLY